jgi:hypothetical protein
MVIVAAPFTFMSAAKAWRGEFRPSPVTWGLWATAPLIAATAAFQSGAGTSAVSTLAAGVGPLIILGASLAGPHRAHRWPVTRFDIVCATFAVAALVGWWLTGSGLVAVCFSVAADAAGAVPTYRKAWSTPESETPLGYIAGLVTGLTGLLTLQVWIPANWLFPAWLVLACSTLIATIAVRGHQVGASSTPTPTPAGGD